MPNSWDGTKERRQSVVDHDTLIEVVQILKNQIENHNTVEDAFRIHEIKDEQNFTSIRHDILNLQKVVWIATGILISLDAMPKLIEVVKSVTGH